MHLLAPYDRGCVLLECRQAGAIPQLVRMLSSGDESSITAAAVWAILQLAGDSPDNKKVLLPSSTNIAEALVGPCAQSMALGCLRGCMHLSGIRQRHTSGHLCFHS